jgi:hypothetical protein
MNIFLWTYPVPDLSKRDTNAGNTGEISFKPFTVPIFPKLTSGWQLLVNNSFADK